MVSDPELLRGHRKFLDNPRLAQVYMQSRACLMLHSLSMFVDERRDEVILNPSLPSRGRPNYNRYISSRIYRQLQRPLYRLFELWRFTFCSIANDRHSLEMSNRQCLYSEYYRRDHGTIH